MNTSKEQYTFSKFASNSFYRNQNAELISLCDLQLNRTKERNEGIGVKVYQDYNEMLEKENIHIVCLLTPMSDGKSFSTNPMAMKTIPTGISC